MNSSINILIVGLGYHARRIYAPYISTSKDVKIAAVLDVESQKNTIEKYITEKAIDTKTYYTNNTNISDRLSKHEVRQLDSVVRE